MGLSWAKVWEKKKNETGRPMHADDSRRIVGKLMRMYGYPQPPSASPRSGEFQRNSASRTRETRHGLQKKRLGERWCCGGARAGARGQWVCKIALTLIRWNHVPSTAAYEHDLRSSGIECVCRHLGEGLHVTCTHLKMRHRKGRSVEF